MFQPFCPKNNNNKTPKKFTSKITKKDHKNTTINVTNQSMFPNKNTFNHNFSGTFPGNYNNTTPPFPQESDTYHDALPIRRSARILDSSSSLADIMNIQHIYQQDADPQSL
jgi:hypothetical protein